MRGNNFEKHKSELFSPIWISAARLLFAAVLLYVIKNPAPLRQLEANFQTAADVSPTAIMNIPVSNVAIASTERQVLDNQPM